MVAVLLTGHRGGPHRPGWILVPPGPDAMAMGNEGLRLRPHRTGRSWPGCGFDRVAGLRYSVAAIFSAKRSVLADGGIIYLLFISFGLILFITEMTLFLRYYKDESFWTCGTYTAARLIFVSRDWDRWKRHLCLQCGYDLCGCEPNGTRSCPECGEPIPVRAAVKVIRRDEGGPVNRPHQPSPRLQPPLSTSTGSRSSRASANCSRRDCF